MAEQAGFSLSGARTVTEAAIYEDTIAGRFLAFHSSNPWVLTTLIRLADQYRSRGYTKVGIGHLWEVLRWEMAMTISPPSGELFKLNNNHRSRYARLIVQKRPDLASMFSMRGLRS